MCSTMFDSIFRILSEQPQFYCERLRRKTCLSLSWACPQSPSSSSVRTAATGLLESAAGTGLPPLLRLNAKKKHWQRVEESRPISTRKSLWKLRWINLILSVVSALFLPPLCWISIGAPALSPIFALRTARWIHLGKGEQINNTL